MTLKECYDNWLNEIYRDCGCDGVDNWDDLPCWITGGREPAELMEENDPVGYRCGYADFCQQEQFDGMDCPECGRTFDDDDIHRLVNDLCMEDEMECRVCEGIAFVCENCGDVFTKGEHASDEVCDDCAEDIGEDEEEEEDGE